MDAPMEINQRADLRDYLAAERTFLAWIRTGLALMGFGFVAARFGLFLQQLRLIDHAPSVPSYGVSLWFGTALIAVGVFVNIFAGWHHLRLVRELDRGRTEHLSSFDRGRGGCFLSSLGRAGNDALSDFSKTFHGFAV